jgi:hypothetical protein
MGPRKNLWSVVLVQGLWLFAGCDGTAGDALSELPKTEDLPIERHDHCLGKDAGEPQCEPPDTVPDFSLATFSNPTLIDNRYFPLVVGATKTYESQDGSETTVVEVLNRTRQVSGVTCRVVRDRVYLNGVILEDTHDFFAQDDHGNVWYMGEDVDNFVYNHRGLLFRITHEGAWEAGLDVAGIGTFASPGIVMKANPLPGDVYHQEFYRTEAEDMAEVIALNVPVMLADGSSFSCLQTRDFTPLDRRSNEYKYFAPGVGLVLEEDVRTGDRTDLVTIEP